MSTRTCRWNGSLRMRMAWRMAELVGEELPKRGLTLRQFAAMVHTSHPPVQRWATGKQPVPAAQWIPVARALGIDLRVVADQTRATIAHDEALDVFQRTTVDVPKLEAACHICGELWWPDAARPPRVCRRCASNVLSVFTMPLPRAAPRTTESPGSIIAAGARLPYFALTA